MQQCGGTALLLNNTNLTIISTRPVAIYTFLSDFYFIIVLFSSSSRVLDSFFT
jgi:hypothetical protein